MLRLDRIVKIYETSTLKVEALKGISLCFRNNEFVAILGPSGCGKTTALNVIGGLDHCTSGDLVINGVSTKKFSGHDWDVYRNHRIGFIFQAYNLIPHESVLENVELALTISGLKKEERVARAKKALDNVGLEGLYAKKPNELSGGQCQRVAIARALVNEPDILLADEPTGALDSVTSVQIMDLIKEISKDKLVIMVTHNDELAKEYATRIINLKDGEVIGDSHPYSAEDEEKERAKEDFSPVNEKAKMHLWTAFKLSAKNLLSKAKRTALIVVASSIGIVGVSAVLSMNFGVRGYIASVQDDMLSGNPVEVAETSLNLSGLMDSASTARRASIVSQSWRNGKIDVEFAMESLVRAADALDSSFTTNHLTKDYEKFIDDMPRDYYAAVSKEYGINVKNNLYTTVGRDPDDPGIALNDALPGDRYSIAAITSFCETILAGARDGEFAAYSSLVDNYSNAIGQSLDAKEYVLSQYEVVEGRYAEGADEAMIVLNHRNQVTEFVLTLLGFYSQDEFTNAIYKYSEDPRFSPSLWEKQTSIDVADLVGHSYYYYPNDTVITPTGEDPQVIGSMTVEHPYDYAFRDRGALTDGHEVKVVGVLTPKASTSYGCYSSGLYLTPAFAKRFLQENHPETGGSSFTADMKARLEANNSDTYTTMKITTVDPGTGVKATVLSGLYYSFNLVFEEHTLEGYGLIGGTSSMGDLFAMLTSTIGGGGDGMNIQTARIGLRDIGGVDFPNRIEVYPKSFNSKDLVTDYLTKWNDDGDLELTDGTVLPKDSREEITYADNLAVIIAMINGIIDIVTIALIAFTALSLVVSTVMIGIITYVSVMERVKEIGVIRSLGGSKRDVSHLFNAETFIIGGFSGIFGLLVTYLFELIMNLTVGAYYNLGMISNLPWFMALAVLSGAILLTMIAGIIPARAAAKQDPVVALRTE